MSAEPCFVMAWRCDGEVSVLNLVDRDGDPTILATELLDALEARGVPLGKVADATWRGIAGERAGQLAEMRLLLAEANDRMETQQELIDAYRNGELGPLELELAK